ncbi:heparinase II/III family protein [Caulobacter sp. S45]|uniref:heparinase II/III family protein n=1 Tax=Caulobacter sp. S45 TaxID=1641861 RepID=UPI0020C66397|nr:heparinase II/III family protein [Caulobacter sp. S45]
MAARAATKAKAGIGLWALAIATAATRRLAYEWRGVSAGSHRLQRSHAPKLMATPRDFRPADPEVGRAILAGRLRLAGAELEIGPGGDPWDRPSPTRRFAVELHRFAFAPHLIACGEAGAREALRLFLGWRRLFHRPNAFAWGADVLELRVFNLAAGARRMSAVASDVEAAELTGSLLHQARVLLSLAGEPARAAERACVVAVAAGALTGVPAERLLDRAQAKLATALGDTVLPDGGHRTRAPQAALELLFDLLTLDDLLLQRGREASPAMVSAMDRLGAALRFHTLSDGRLAGFHGGEAVESEGVAAALNEDAFDTPAPGHAPHSAYHRLDGPKLHLLVDCGPPAAAAWSVTACAQPAALELTASGDRLFCGGGWSADAAGPQALRLAAAGSTVQVGGGSAGRPLTGFLARALGSRLVDGAVQVTARREENEAGVWLEVSHDGWAREFGLTHDRRLFVDGAGDEVRGEDVLTPALGKAGPKSAVPYAVRFHVFPEVESSLARDGRSILLRGPSNRGWWFRNDATEVGLEPSVCFRDGLPRRTVQIVLRGEMGQEGARIRWKLTPVEPPRPRPRASPSAPQLEPRPEDEPAPPFNLSAALERPVETPA